MMNNYLARITHKLLLSAILFLSLLLSACQSAIDERGYTQDSWESFNRSVFAFNTAIDNAVIKPAAQAYTFVFPSPARTGIRNFFSNLDDMRSLVNAILQLDGPTSARISARVIDNTFFGLGGIFDVATPMGNKKIERDFGSTLARYGVPSGPFVMLPFWGPTTVRDGLGKIPDSYLSPIYYLSNDKVRIGAIVLSGLQSRSELLPLEKNLEGTTTDRYATIRDSWLQHRWAQLGTPITPTQQDDIDALFVPESPQDSPSPEANKKEPPSP